MAEQITQENRLLAVYTPAGQDVLLISSFAGSESISQPFRYTVKMVADVQSNKPAQVKQVVLYIEIVAHCLFSWLMMHCGETIIVFPHLVRNGDRSKHETSQVLKTWEVLGKTFIFAPFTRCSPEKNEWVSC